MVVADVDGRAAEAVARECAGLGSDAFSVAVDVADEASVAALADAVRTRSGGADVLVNNAAVFATVPLRRVGVEGLSVLEWDQVMEVNVRGTFLCARAFVPQMRARGGGRIVNVSSGTAFHGGGAPFHYVTSKAAVIGLTRALARELGRDGITVNAVAPGATPTEATTEEERERQSLTIAARAIGRPEAPGDLVGAVLFLASPAASFITGQTLVVDGGRVMH